MKRIIILLSIALLCISVSTFAEESVLIDFSTLVADNDGENEATLIDFSDKAGTSFTEAEKVHMKTSLALSNWDVELASSSKTVVNQKYSIVKPATVREGASRFGGDTVLGVRIHFPEEPFNSWALIKPPFEIPAYEPKDENDMSGSKFNNYGVVKNVGVLKSVSINVLGKNFPNGFGILLQDQDNNEKNIFIGNLEYDGWKTLTWMNPNYIDDVRNREIKKYPLYPKAAPMLKFIGLIIYKDAAQEGGDIVTYIKDIKLTYDKAVLTLESDVDDEALWGILEERERSRRSAEFERLGNKQVLRYLETQKMHVDEEE